MSRSGRLNSRVRVHFEELEEKLVRLNDEEDDRNYDVD